MGSRRTVLLTLTVAAGLAAVLAMPAPAWAKGPSRATVAGPGLATPIVVRDSGESGSGGKLAELADRSGLFAAMFGDTPDPMRAAPPTKDLGPRYTVAYLVPGGTRDASVEQLLYPLAASGPVTYLAPGQRIFDTDRTYGGWYRAAPALLDTLRELGVPLVRSVGVAPTPVSPVSPGAVSSQPAAEPSGFPWRAVVLGAAGLVMLVLLPILLARERSAARQRSRS